MRTFQRALAVSGLATFALTVAATAASAHVIANPSTAEPGSYSKVSFRVPNEEQTADTTTIEVTLAAGIIGVGVGAYGVTRKRAS